MLFSSPFVVKLFLEQTGAHIRVAGREQSSSADGSRSSRLYPVHNQENRGLRSKNGFLQASLTSKYFLTPRKSFRLDGVYAVIDKVSAAGHRDPGIACCNHVGASVKGEDEHCQKTEDEGQTT